MSRWLLAALMAALIPGLAAAQIQEKPQKPDDLTKLDVEELMMLEVTTAGKRSQSLSDVLAAVYVITAEEIKRSGANSIPELLRFAPGVQVAQLSAGQYAVSIRGFNGLYTNKLLVLIDGRSVYSPFFGGVFWDSVDYPLEDIERIEVIRGPGGALWGANAANGIINIITKSATDTIGGLVTGGFGITDRRSQTFRLGKSTGENSGSGLIFERSSGMA